MSRSDRAVRVAGAWLAVASFLMVVVFAFHGPIPHEMHGRMARIAGAGMEWPVVHWIAAAGLSLYAVCGLIVLTSQSRLTESGSCLTAWAVVSIGALWTVTTAVAETAVLTDVALSGSEETFAAWWAFAEAKGSGFAFVALAVAVIAAAEARSLARLMPAWAGWIGVAAGVGSFAGWALGMWLGIAIGNLLWMITSMIMSLWLLWFGIALLRMPAGAGAGALRANGYRQEANV